jgi:hypothetical protein
MDQIKMIQTLEDQLAMVDFGSIDREQALRGQQQGSSVE